MRFEAVLLVTGLVLCVESRPEQPPTGSKAVNTLVKDPAYCCVPDQWESLTAGLMSPEPNSNQGLQQESVLVSYDATGQKVNMAGSILTNTGLEPYRILFDFTQQKKYSVDKDGSCIETPRKVKFAKFCIVEGSTYLGHFTLGVGNNMISADLFHRDRKYFYSTMAVIKTNCVPVTETVWGVGGGTKASLIGKVDVPMLGATVFSNFTLGIKSMSVFDPPKECVPGEIKHHSSFMEYMAQQFSEL